MKDLIALMSCLKFGVIHKQIGPTQQRMGLEGTNHIKLDILDKPYQTSYYEHHYIFPNLYYETFKKIPEVWTNLIFSNLITKHLEKSQKFDVIIVL